MLKKIKDLVFGFEEFEKTKFEVRFEYIQNYISQIKIEKLEDFETLEDIIFKITESLRIRSSNLNKTIADPSNKLRKKDVLNIIETLNNYKYTFLKTAFNDIKNNSNLIEEKNYPENNKSVKIHKTSDSLKTSDLPKKNLNISLENIKLFENDDYKIILENQKVPFIIIHFKSEFDLNLIKHLSSYFFESFSPEGTNIIIENNIALIIPRFQNDNLISLTSIEIDISYVFNKIQETIKNQEKIPKKQLRENHSNLKIESEDDENDEKYETFDFQVKKNDNIFSKKEDSLDALLESEVHSKDHINPFKDSDESHEIKIIKSDPIKVEVNEAKVEEKLQDNLNKKEKLANEEIIVEKINSVKNKFEIYSDEKIQVFLNENSSILGELILEPINSSINSLNDSDLSYISIFSKIFSSVLFEISQAHGTNIFWNFNDNQIKIIPRFQNDKLNLSWKGMQLNEDSLKNIQNMLISKMHEELNSESNHNNNSNMTSNTNQNQNNNKNPISETPSEKEDKIKYVLEQLRRIP